MTHYQRQTNSQEHTPISRAGDELAGFDIPKIEFSPAAGFSKPNLIHPLDFERLEEDLGKFDIQKNELGNNKVAANHELRSKHIGHTALPVTYTKRDSEKTLDDLLTEGNSVVAFSDDPEVKTSS